MNIGILDLHREYKSISTQVQNELNDCFNTQGWILGKKVTELENMCAQYLNIKYTVGLNSGTDALILALRALAIKLKGREFFDKKDEIITTPFTFIATAEAIVLAGATPVFVDIDNDFNISPEAIEKAINKNTVGIIPVHLYGLCAKMREIKKIANRHKLFIVEDVAQAFGAVCGGKKAGTIGDIGCYSFFPSKNLGAYGDGGLITTNDKKLGELFKVLRNHGQTETYKAKHIGYNSRLDSIQAAVLKVKLETIDAMNNKRAAIAAQYDAAFQNNSNLTTPPVTQGSSHVYNLYTLRVKYGRDKLLKHLNDNGVGARVYYPYLLSDMPAYACAKIKGKLVNAKSATHECLTLPVHPFLTQEEISYVIKFANS
jgi:UDP-2-acetamido-2-deoxy-ribo-hexuluronate aminotransferase